MENQKEELQEEKTIEEKKKLKGCGCALLLLLFGFVVWLIIPSQPKKEDDKEVAYYSANGYVSKKLKCPSTAKYPLYDDSYVKKEGDSAYIVVGIVDAQNGFGAMIRSKYVVKMISDGKDAYKVEYCLIDGEPVY